MKGQKGRYGFLKINFFNIFQQLKSTMSLEQPNVLKHEMLGTNGGKDSYCVREFFKDKMKCVCYVEDVVTTRMYDRK